MFRFERVGVGLMIGAIIVGFMSAGLSDLGGYDHLAEAASFVSFLLAILAFWRIMDRDG